MSHSLHFKHGGMEMSDCVYVNRDLCLPVLVCTHQGTVARILHRVDDAQLIEHLADDDDAHPNGGQAGGHVPETGVRHGEGPENHQNQVHHRGLREQSPHQESMVFGGSVNSTGVLTS